LPAGSWREYDPTGERKGGERFQREGEKVRIRAVGIHAFRSDLATAMMLSTPGSVSFA
jgi:hypothetical protein